jgi:hypothetical protein
MGLRWDPIENPTNLGNYKTNINNFHNSGSMIDNFTQAVVIGNFKKRIGNITTTVDNSATIKSNIETSRQR